MALRGQTEERAERKGLQQTLCFLTYHTLVIPNAGGAAADFPVFSNIQLYVDVLLNRDAHSETSSSVLRLTSIRLYPFLSGSLMRPQPFLTVNAFCLNLHRAFFFMCLL